MSEIRPFPGIRYATGPDRKDISSVLAPPYDVLDQADKDALLARDPHNFVAIDLPHMPPKAAGPIPAYTDANRQMRAWIEDGVMVHDAAPALYVYHQTFTHDGTEYVRKMFFARLRIEKFGEGSVFPHEHTFGGPKEDRLALTKATTCNMSPIFGLYPDAQNVVAARLEQAIGSAAPLAEGRLDATHNKLWAVTDARTIADVTGLMADKAMYIADGHHRYGTAGLYRDWLVSLQGELPGDHPANFVLCVMCGMEDPGLLILPTHRVLPGVEITGGLLREDTQLEVAHLPVDGPEQVPAALAKFGPLAVAVTAGDGYLMVRPREETLLDGIAADHSVAWRRLGLAFLHAYLLDKVVTPKLCGGQAPEIRYIKAAAPAVAEARETKGCAFLLQATTMDEMRAVCSAGDLMPQKSTFFYPKLASGLVVNPLDA